MEKPIIEVRNIGKKYNITHQRGGYIALRDVLMNVLKSPFSFLKTKAKQVAGFEKKEEFWALKDVSFDVQKGEVVGIIGANGAGKSTLLKILSQITPPTEGEIILRGRVGSLLEVGTGFHPELTGRENIFLNGAILSMKKKEIAKKFDEIVAFAGIGKFLDTPVKRYSSGMYVRLAFSVAAHMEPDILIIDEVLAVGDAEFQKKCLGKMEDITKSEGRTILFVSHNMEAIRQLCSKTILLKNGRVEKFEATNEVISEYIKINQPSEKFVDFSKNNRRKNKVFRNLEIENIDSIKSMGKVAVKIEYFADKPIDNPQFSLAFNTMEGIRIFTVDSSRQKSNLSKQIYGKGIITCQIGSIPLLPGNYSVQLILWQPGEKIDEIVDAANIRIIQDPKSRLESHNWIKMGIVYVGARWSADNNFN